MNRKTIGLYLLFLSAVLGTIGALGHTFTSIPAISNHFSYEPDKYWANRLNASLILGTTGLYFGAAITWLGAIISSSKEQTKHTAAFYVLIISIFPHIVSFFALPLLTPSDWPHMIIHGLVILFIPVGLFLRK